MDGLAFQADQEYHFSIHIDGARKINVFVNGQGYGLANTAALTGARDYGATGCLVNEAAGYGTTGSETTITVDGTSASTVFTPGNTLMNASGSIYGVVKTVNSATSITLNSVTTALANNDDLYLQGALAVKVSDQSDALASGYLFPFAGIYIDDQSTTTARHMYMYNMNISQLI